MTAWASTESHKDPSESILPRIDFSADMDDAETVVAIDSVVATPSGLTVASNGISSDGKRVQIRISGGTDGERYEVRVTVTTSAPQTLAGGLYCVVCDDPSTG